MVSSNYFYLIIVNCLFRGIWFKVNNNNNNNNNPKETIITSSNYS